MYQLHGFMVINSLVNNEYQETSVLGELSNYSRSFSREIAQYVDTTNAPGVRLMVFHAYLDNTPTPLSNELANEVLALGSWLANESLLHRVDGDKNTLSQKLVAEYQGRVKFLEVGKMIHDGKYYLPEYLVFKLESDKRENRYKVWFADDSFQHQYDKFEIDVIPQIPNVDDFHKGQEFVRQILTENTLGVLHERVNVAAARTPYTSIHSYKYDWINPDDPQDRIPTYWTCIIYGETGKNIDIIRGKMIDYVLSHSDYTRDQWEKILPDLFVPTEFYLSPVWTKFATENLQLQGGIHSPTIPYRFVIPWCKRTMHGYDDEHLQTHAAIFNTIFKSIAVIACGHKQNRLAPINFEEAWPQYINVYTTSRDFNRINQRTRKFIMFMNELLLEAERMTPDTEIPQEMTRVKRGEMWYVTKAFENVTYLMPLRYNFLAEIAENVDNTHITFPVVHSNGVDETTSDESVFSIRDYTTRVREAVEAGDPVIHQGRPTTAPVTLGN